jgi:hypothetical protein
MVAPGRRGVQSPASHSPVNVSNKNRVRGLFLKKKTGWQQEQLVFHCGLLCTVIKMILEISLEFRFLLFFPPCFWKISQLVANMSRGFMFLVLEFAHFLIFFSKKKKSLFTLNA